ncbi:MAG: extracellular solute-binding protein [Myxococcales bacterium]|nr:extracellular solute-binding protein [Myxococcales bacterium]MDH5565759.1 extracellular solute-binding protein [Myxococcales bacterium]
MSVKLRSFAALGLVSLVLLVVGIVARPGLAQPVHGLAMHGDLKYAADFQHFDFADPDAPQGGTMRMATIGSFDSFNPFIIKGTSASGLTFLGQSLLYDSLLKNAEDEPFSEYGLLAESVETPRDRSWVAFTLRPEARWHDGQPITAADVIWTFETLMAKGMPFYRAYFGSVAKVEQTGPRSVKFSFVPGDNRELPLILGQMPILPAHYWATREFDATTLEPPLGSGPYAIAEFEAGRFVSWKRRPDYWGRALPVNRGRYNFDVWRFDYFRDDDVAIEALKGGAYDYRAENNSKKWATAYDVPDVRAGRLRKELIPNRRTQGGQGFLYNLRREIFADRKVRRALGYAFDFEWSNKTLFYGQYQRTRSHFENSELAARGLPSAEELAILAPYRGRIPEEVFTQAYAPPVTDGSGNIRENLKTAVALLAEAGWSIRDGVMTHGASGARLEFEILLVSPAFERVVLPFKKNLERIGVLASVRTVDVSQYRRRLDTFDFDMIVGGYAQSESPGNEQRDFWSSASAEIEGGRNLNGIRDPVVDELVALVISAPDRKALVARTRALDRVLLWSYCMIPHWYISADRILYWDRFGRPALAPDRGVSIETWWIDAAKDAALERRRGQGGS